MRYSVARLTPNAAHAAATDTSGSVRSSTRSISCPRRSRAVPAPEARALFLERNENVGDM